jgi:endonuclease/exonuclease/phosphatase family metal-dependent hydrolase
MITVHTRPSLAKAEIPYIAAAMDEVAAALGETDVLCAGDFNADGGYYDEGPGPELAGFPSARFVSVVPNDADTTVAAESLAYDRMELSASMAGDYAGSWGVIRPGGLYDLSACEGTGSSAGTERALSDHYPIWAEFSTTADRD